jgi:hypothetical protein
MESLDYKTDKPWIATSRVPANIPVKFEVLGVTPLDDQDKTFFMNCMIHDGEFKGKTTRLYWYRFRKSDGKARADFTSLCKAVLPDKYRNSEKIHSFDFIGKCFESTPKCFGHDGGVRIFVKVREIELDVRS